MKFLAIGIFGLIGIYLRYFIGTIPLVSSNALSIFLANSLGCMFAGSIFALSQIKGEQIIFTALLVGLCGGLTTFSGYNLEFLNQLNKGLYSKALFYFLTGPIIGLILMTATYFSTLTLVKS